MKNKLSNLEQLIILPNKSFRDFVDICKLDKAKGLDIGESYVNDKGAAVLVSNIANVTLQPVVIFLVKKVQACKKYVGHVKVLK
ncbi:hypothetical protein DPMN_118655 [Dreissena polymorpha]|uniref:Uncharacterized protein n=1 Tax=Dreissena polymorpha TaxID=45954 RepID=A0A9D4GGU5_DREPO|nr:hypothetical protein DPMN_118655 [Dreissena polymorpha]